MTQLDGHLSRNIQKQIRRAAKEVTILFTDIEESAKYWDSRGDVEGRLMVDAHNRLIFPVVKKYHGKVVKTIGDAVMASFKRPSHAIQAAIGIQKTLQKERETEPDFPKIRIGIHTGEAIVEKQDVFGDTVNMASRIEKRAKAGEILISSKTAKRVPLKRYNLVKKEKFTPKGKTKEITVYKCDWKSSDRFETMEMGTPIALKNRQKWELLGATALGFGFIIFLFIKYLRYFLADSEALALFVLNPKDILLENPWMIAILGAILIGLIFLIFKLKSVSILMYKIINGGLGFCMGFFLVYIPLTLIPIQAVSERDRVLYQSKHLFVEITAVTAALHQEPYLRSPVMRTMPKGMLLLLSDVDERGEVQWNKVLIGEKTHGWVQRVLPPKIGVPEKRISKTYKFYFKLKDVLFLCVGLIGFLVGFFRFRIKPA